MTPTFARWIEDLIRRRLRRSSWLLALQQEWVVPPFVGFSTAVAVNLAVREWHGFRCAHCQLSFWVDRPATFMAVCKDGRLCFRCASAAGLVRSV